VVEAVAVSAARGARVPLAAAAVTLAALIVAILVPWPLTVGGRFVAGPVAAASLVARQGASVARVYAPEGTRVAAGDPVVRLRSFDLQTEALHYARVADSLDNLAEVARSRGLTAEADRLAALERAQGALLTGTETRLSTLLLRAPIAGVVVTPRLEEKVGQWVDTGTVVARVVEDDSVEVRVTLDPALAAMVRPGQTVLLISDADRSRPIEAAVGTVATASGGGRLEARIHLPAVGPGWRVGVTGEAKIVMRRTNLLGAVNWALIKRIRSDLML
jgi:multidrug resistance efflux pump